MILLPKIAVVITTAASVITTGLAIPTAGSVIAPDSLAPTMPEVYVVDAESAETSAKVPGATFYPTGSIDSGTLVVMPEVYLSLGLTAEEMAGIDTKAELDDVMSSAMASCGGVAVGRYGAWGAVSNSPVSIAGHSGYKQDYSWGVLAGTNQDAATLGLGYFQGYNGSELGIWSKYYSIGVGASGSALIPWGNVWAVPKFKVQSTNAGHLAQVSWQC